MNKKIVHCLVEIDTSVLFSLFPPTNFGPSPGVGCPATVPISKTAHSNSNSYNTANSLFNLAKVLKLK